METSVRDYASKNPEADYSEITARFGTPQQIASSYVDEMETTDLIQELRVRKKIVGIVALIAVIIVALWINLVVVSYADHAKNTHGYAMVDVIEESVAPKEYGGTK